MAILHAKQVAVRGLIEVGHEHKAVLVNLVWIIGHEADPSGEGIFSHHVALDIKWLALVGRESHLCSLMLVRFQIRLDCLQRFLIWLMINSCHGFDFSYGLRIRQRISQAWSLTTMGYNRRMSRFLLDLARV